MLAGHAASSVEGEADMSSAPTPQLASADAMALPAPFVNHMQATLYGTGLVRLAFAEIPSANAQPSYRSAIIMTVQDFQQMFQGMLETLAKGAAPAPEGLRN